MLCSLSNRLTGGNPLFQTAPIESRFSGPAGGRHGPDNRGLRRHVAGRCQDLIAARQGDRAHRGGLFLRRHRPDRAGLADPGHARDQVRDRTRGRHGSAARPCSECSSARPARASSAIAGAARRSTSSTCCCSASSPSSVRWRRTSGGSSRRASLPASASAASSRSPLPTPANIRPRPSAAAFWRSCTSSAAPACGRSRRCSRCSSAIPSAGAAYGSSSASAR